MCYRFGIFSVKNPKEVKMFRLVATQLSKVGQSAILGRAAAVNTTATARFCHPGTPDIYDPTFDARYEQYFKRPDIDHWECRKAMNDLLRMDLIPDPKIIIAALHACRRLNDYALTTRWLEGVKNRCGGDDQTYQWILNEIRPTLNELGVSTPEELGYGVPELALKRPHEY